MAEASASRAALLALRRETRIIEEGHRFLDERRVALARELLRRARDHAAHRVSFLQLAARARQALGDAVGRHGFEGLQVCPAATLAAASFEREEAPFLGLRLVIVARLPLAAVAAPAVAFPSSESAQCAEAFRELAQDAATLAGEVASLLRLMAEYRRAERRVRAIENIVLPEARQDQRRFESALEELDQEEVMRVRRFAGERS